MDACCSFKSIVGGNCGFDRHDRKQDTEIVPLLACSKPTDNHRRGLGIFGTVDEVDLILSRAAIFTPPQNINSMTTCPLHCSKLGLGWTKGSNTKCRVPSEVSQHGKGCKKWPKCDRGIDKDDSKLILKKTGIFLPVGSGKLLFPLEFLGFLENCDIQLQQHFVSSRCLHNMPKKN